MPSKEPIKQPLIVVPAYGRDYKTQAEAVQAWKDGKDFLIQDVSSRDDLSDDNRDGVKIRYNKLEDIVFVYLDGRVEGTQEEAQTVVE